MKAYWNMLKDNYFVKQAVLKWVGEHALKRAVLDAVARKRHKEIHTEDPTDLNRDGSSNGGGNDDIDVAE